MSEIDKILIDFISNFGESENFNRHNLRAIAVGYSDLVSGNAVSNEFEITQSAEDRSIIDNLNSFGQSHTCQQGKFVLNSTQSSATTLPPDDWSDSISIRPATILNYLINRNIKKNGDIAILMSIKNEGPWLLEWLSHYLAIGISSFFIYYNDTDDLSDQILMEASKFCKIILVKNNFDPSVSPQKRAYKNAIQYSRDLHAYQWVAALDADEFLFNNIEPTETHSALQQLNSREYQNVNAIALNWNWFQSIDTFFWEKDLTTRRFKHYIPHAMKKCLFRPEFTFSLENVHFPKMIETGLFLDSSGELVQNISSDVTPKGEIKFGVNHYFARSFEEFSLKKLRGRGAVAPSETQRQFDNFTWGYSDKNNEFEYNSDYRNAFDRIYGELNADPGIAAAQEESERLARERLTMIYSSSDLKSIYRQITGRDIRR